MQSRTIMQFNEREMNRILLAVEHYKECVGVRSDEYDKIIDKLHSYEEEYECPDCVLCTIHQ